MKGSPTLTVMVLPGAAPPVAAEHGSARRRRWHRPRDCDRSLASLGWPFFSRLTVLVMSTGPLDSPLVVRGLARGIVDLDVGEEEPPEVQRKHDAESGRREDEGELDEGLAEGAPTMGARSRRSTEVE